MKKNTLNRILSMALATAMSLVLYVPAFAASSQPYGQDDFSLSAIDKRVRVTITVKSEDEIIDFLKSERYNPNVSYTFICPSQIQTRILCPKCKNNRFIGMTEHRDMAIALRICPNGSGFDVDDTCTEYHVYTYSYCDYCGYTTTPTFGRKYWVVACQTEMPDGWGTYIARPGQTWQQGYDFHEDPYYMNLI